MSCEHGNWPPCDECDALDAKWDAGYAAGRASVDGLLLLLLECDAAIVLLGGESPAQKLREKIAETLTANKQ